MRIAIILFALGVLQVNANNAYSQKTRLSINFSDASLISVIDKIEEESEFFFMYNEKLLDTERKVTINAKDQFIDSILDNLFTGTDTKFTIIDRQIILAPDFLSKGSSEMQQKQVTGTITSSNGDPMAGVTILVKGTTVGTITGLDGKYSLNVPDPANNTLVFSFVGFTSKEVAVAGKSVMDVALDEELTGLDEVVVIGYGTARRSDLVGATSSISTKDVINQPAARVDQVLQGRSPGIAIQNTSSDPNGVVTIRIRGSNSLTGSNDPLVVVDGFIGGDLSTLNPNDIASIEILKDASSTAIYGSRGANGVIMVTTKRGADKTVVEYNGFTNFQQISKKMDLLNAAEYAETVNANRTDLGKVLPFTDAQIADFSANGGTDWQDVVFRNAIQQSHQLSVSGGSKMNNYYLSANYINNEGIMLGSSYNRYSLRSNIESTLNDKFKTGVNIFLSNATDHPATTRGSQDSSPTQAALIWAPTKAIYQDNGKYTRPGGGYGPPAVNNPLGLAVEPIRDYISTRGEINSYINYNIIEGLSARVILGAVLSDNEQSIYQNTKAAGDIGDATASLSNRRSWVLQNTNQINYSTKIAQVHSLNVTAAFEQQRETSNNSFAASNGFSSDVLTYNNLSIGTKPQTPSSGRSRKDIISFVGRVNYSYKDKYLLSVNSRYDGASVFGALNKWGFFPSAALAWRVTGEEFMKSYPTISNLKVRTSYGVTGNQGINAYASLSTLNTTRQYAMGSAVQTGVGLGTLANPDLRWEKTGQFNVGVDLGMYKGRLTASADYYNKETNDLLMNVPQPRVTGYATVLQNIGSVQNQGFEFIIGGDPINGDFKWNTNFNISMNKNQVLALSGEKEVPLGTGGFPNFGQTIFLQVGQPIGVLKGYIQEGIWGTDEAAEAASYGTIPGAPKYRDMDVNGESDGKITSADIAIMGNTYPKFTYGFTNNFSYKNFDMNIFLQGSQGNDVYNLTRIRSERTSADADATDRRILNRWTPENQNTDVPSFIGSNSYEQLQSSRWMEDGSYMRIKNITLGFTLPSSLSSRAHISSARFYVSGVNLLTFTKYTGYDPESSTNVGTLGGFDMAPYPSQKMYTIGVNLKF